MTIKESTENFTPQSPFDIDKLLSLSNVEKDDVLSKLFYETTLPNTTDHVIDQPHSTQQTTFQHPSSKITEGMTPTLSSSGLGLLNTSSGKIADTDDSYLTHFNHAKERFSNRFHKDGNISRINLLIAIADLEKVLSLKPEFADARYLLGESNMYMGQFYFFEQKKLRETYPNVKAKTTDAHEIQVIHMMNDHAKKCREHCLAAINNYEIAINLKESLSFDAYRHIGNCYGYMGENARAIEVYTDLLSEFPEDEKLRTYRGNQYRLLGRFKEAIEDFEKIPSSSRFKPQAVDLLIKCFLAIGDTDSALKHIQIPTQCFRQAFSRRDKKTLVFIANCFQEYNVEEFFPLKSYIIGVGYEAIGNEVKSSYEFKKFITWHVLNPDSKYRYGYKEINYAMSSYLHSQQTKDHSDAELEELRELLRKVENITTTHSRLVNYFMGLIHTKSSKHELAFQYYDKSNRLQQETRQNLLPEVANKLHKTAQAIFENMDFVGKSNKASFKEKDEQLRVYLEFQDRILNYYPSSEGKQKVSGYQVPSISLSAVDDYEPTTQKSMQVQEVSDVQQLEKILEKSNEFEKQFIFNNYSYLLSELNDILHESFEKPSSDLFIYYEHVQMNSHELSSYPIHLKGMEQFFQKILLAVSNFNSELELRTFRSILAHFMDQFCNLVSYEGMVPEHYGMGVSQKMIQTANRRLYNVLDQFPEDFKAVIKSKINFQNKSYFVVSGKKLTKSKKVLRYVFYSSISLKLLELEWRKNNVSKWLCSRETISHKNQTLLMYCLSPMNSFEVAVYTIQVFYDERGLLRHVNNVQKEDREYAIQRLKNITPKECWNTTTSNSYILYKQYLVKISDYLNKVSSNEKTITESYIPLFVTESVDRKPSTKNSDPLNRLNIGINLTTMVEALNCSSTKHCVRPTPSANVLQEQKPLSRKRSHEGSFELERSDKRQKTHNASVI